MLGLFRDSLCGAPFNITTDVEDDINVFNGLKILSSRGCIRCVLCDGSDNMPTPSLRAISTVASLWLWLLCADEINYTFSCGIGFKWRIHSQNTWASIQSLSWQWWTMPGVLHILGSPSFFSWNKSALEEHRNHSHLLHTHQLHYVLFHTTWWLQRHVFLFPLWSYEWFRPCRKSLQP